MGNEVDMKNRMTWIVVGFLVVIGGCYILYCCFDKQGKKMPWPISGLAPW